MTEVEWLKEARNDLKELPEDTADKIIRETAQSLNDRVNSQRKTAILDKYDVQAYRLKLENVNFRVIFDYIGGKAIIFGVGPRETVYTEETMTDIKERLKGFQ